ncbi:MAG: helix-turn-helix domain-containing protein [Planctomycetota bacterium]
MPKLHQYLRIKDAAAYLGVARNTLRNWEAAGKIKVRWHPMNRYRLFKVSDLDKLLRKTEQSVQPRRSWGQREKAE